MRHINTYKLFESSSVIKQTIEDILIELKDDYYGVHVSTLSNDTPNEYRFQVRIIKESLSQGFYFNDVKDSIERLIEYMKPYKSNRAAHIQQNKLSFQVQESIFIMTWLETNFFDNSVENELRATEKFDLSYENMIHVINKVSKIQGVDDPLIRAIYIQIDIKD